MKVAFLISALASTLSAAVSAQSIISCPIRDRQILSGVGDLTGTYAVKDATNVIVEGEATAKLYPGGSMTARLFINNSEKSSSAAGNSGSNDNSKTVTVSTSFVANPGQEFRVKLEARNEGGEATVNLVRLSCQ